MGNTDPQQLRLDQIHAPAVILVDPETKIPLSPDDVLGMLGALGLAGAVVDPGIPEPTELVDYSPEKEGSLGNATFSELCDFVVSQGHTQAIATNIWQPFAGASSNIVDGSQFFDATEELRARRDKYIGDGQEDSEAVEDIEKMIIMIHKEIYGSNNYVHRFYIEESRAIKHIMDHVIRNAAKAKDGEPFVFVGADSEQGDGLPLQYQGRGIGRDFKDSWVKLDVMYTLFSQREDHGRVNPANKSYPLLIKFLNRRIDQVRATQ